MTPEKAGGPAVDRAPKTAITANQTPESYPTDPTAIDDLLAEVRRWETAARMVADDEERPIRQRYLSLIEMAFKVRRSPHPAFLEAAVWRGCRLLFEDEVKVPHNTIDAIRRLRRGGLSDCPTCRRPLPDHHELDRWRQLEHELYTRRSA